MKIVFLRNEICETWDKALFELTLALSEVGAKEEIEEVVIKSQEEANRHKFIGSPTVLINGKDVDVTTEEAENVAFTACRTYFFKGQVFEYPPKDMIIHAIELYT